MKIGMTTEKLKSTMALLVLGAVIGCGPRQEREVERVETATIQLPTIICNMCAETVEKAITGVKGVQSVTVSLDEKVATVSYTPTTELSSIEEAITAAGYDANDRKADPQAYENLPECCKKDG